VTSTALLQVNTFYFPGWQLYVDGREREIHHSNPQGLMEFAVTPGGHIVELRWGSTVARTWGTWLSALALLLLAATPLLGGRGLGLLRRARRRSSFGSFRFFGRARAGKGGGPPPHPKI
jgi:hypothetical protein